MSISLVRPNPIAPPIMLEAVNYETAFPWISARLFCFENLKFILALDADDNMKHIFLPQLATDAINKKYFGKAKVVISIHRATFSVKIDMNLNFLISTSRFFPNLDAYSIPPSCPNPSFNTH